MEASNVGLEALLTKHTVVSLAVQALIEQLVLTGVVTPPDLVSLRESGLRWADLLKEYSSSGSHVSGDRLDAEIREWWDTLGVPVRMDRLENDT